MTTLRIGTRGSQLALWQANTVKRMLEERGNRVDLVIIKTTGDRLSEASLSDAGGKRLFVKEIEDAMLKRDVDLAVHSSKDMPADLPPGLGIAAVLPREDPRDAIVLPLVGSRVQGPGSRVHSRQVQGPGSVRGQETMDQTSIQRPGTLDRTPDQTSSQRPGTLDRTPDQTSRDPGPRTPDPGPDDSYRRVAAGLGASAAFGTSSIRRIAQLRAAFASATFQPVRGNVDTRLRKLDEGGYDALILAAAGLLRLGLGERISALLPVDICTPAPGQGAIAIEIREDDERTRAAVGALDDPPTAIALQAERALVAALGGGCQLPLGGIAIPDGRDRLALSAVVISADATRVVRERATGSAKDAVGLGRRVADALATRGAGEILNEIRAAQQK